MRYQAFDKRLGDNNAQQVEREILMEVHLQTTLAIDEANVGIARVPNKFMRLFFPLIHILASETLKGKSEHQSGTNLMHHLKARIILLAPIVLVHNAKLVVMPLVERGIHNRGVDAIASLHAMIVAKHQAILFLYLHAKSYTILSVPCARYLPP